MPRRRRRWSRSERDNSKSLANNKLLQPSSFNVYSNEGNANRPKDSYTTNYSLASPEGNYGERSTAEGLQSKVVLKGSKTRAKKKVSNKNIFGKEKSFKKARVRSGAGAKVQKTLLPKKKEFYDTRYDAKSGEVITTKQNRFDRKVYDTDMEFYQSNVGKGARQFNSKEDFVKAKNDWAKTQEAQKDKRDKQEKQLAEFRKFYND